MAFSTAIVQRPMAMGNRRMSQGTFNCSSATGGDVNTGLRKCEAFFAMQQLSAVANAIVVNETLPVDGDAVTIVTDSGAVGNWMAWGY